jgi:hypothetical protein
MPQSVSARDAKLGSGVLILAIGIGMVEVRMNHAWSRGVLLIVALIPFAILLSAALRAPQDDDAQDPSPMTSLLCALAFAFGAVSVYRLGQIVHPSHTLSRAGLVTWLLLCVTAIASVLGDRRRSATLMLVALVAFSAFVFEGCNWLFGIGNDASSYRYIATALIVVYLLGAASIRLWPRLASVMYVAAGVLLFLMAETMFGIDSHHRILPIFFIGIIPKSPLGWLVVIGAGTLVLTVAAMVRKDPGPGYMAALATASWVTLAAAPTRHLSIVGWPLFALVVGAIVVVIAVTDTKSNRFSLTRSPELLAGGAFVLGVGVLLMVERMAFLWSREAEFIIAVVAALLFGAFAIAQRVDDNEPSGATSMLTALTLAAALLALVRGARFHGAFPLGNSGEAAWVAAAAAVIGAALSGFRRSAGVALASIVLAGLAVLLGAVYLFSANKHPVSYTWIFTGLGAVYAALAALTRQWWPRLATVSAVAAGGAVIGAMVTLRFTTLLFVPGEFVKGAPSPGWVVLAVVAAVAMAGAAALMARAAGPGYVAAGLAVFAVLVDGRRVLGHASSLVVWPVVWLAIGAVLVGLGLYEGRPGGGAEPAAAEASG